MKRAFKTTMTLRRLPLFLGLSLALMFLAPRLSFGQLSAASVNGTVKDPSGAVIPKATITLRNVNTSVEHTTVSNGSGVYTFQNVTPGEYTVRVTEKGFRPSEVPAFTLTVSQVATIDFSLQPGGAASTVVVQAATPQLETSSASLGTVIGTRQVNDLPLNGRNFTQLLSLTPGVSTTSRAQNRGGGRTAVALGSELLIPVVNGQTARSNRFMIDGFVATDSLFNEYTVPPIIDAIQEFKVVSHTDSAEFGGVQGGVINVVTKSGTNHYHGSLWDYYRDQILDARGQYFLPPTVQKPKFHQNQFGASVGGPVPTPWENKTFFFGAYQGFRYSRANTALLKVPTDAQLAGDESDWPTQIYNPFSTRPDPLHPGQFIRDPFPGNQIPSNLIDPRAVALAKFIFPRPSGSYAAGRNALNTNPVTQTQNEFDIRVDQKFGANDSAFFHYSQVRSDEHLTAALPIFTAYSVHPGSAWGINYVHVFSPSLILQGQFSRTENESNRYTLATVPTADIYSQVGFSDSFASFPAIDKNLIPDVIITGLSHAGETEQLSPGNTDTYQESATLTKALGDHLLKFGGGYTHLGFSQDYTFSNLGFGGEPTSNPDPNDRADIGDPIASFILNVPSSATHRNTATTLRPGGVMSFFGQDSWKATPRLTLNFGLRYDVTFIPAIGTPGSEGQHGGIQTGDMDFTTGTYILQHPPDLCSVAGGAPCIPGTGLPDHVVVDPRGKIAHNTYTNFGPRLGFAFRLDDKTVFRGAYGILYDNFADQTQQAQSISGGWPDVAQQHATNLNVPSSASATPTTQLQDPFGGGSSTLPPPTPFTEAGVYFDPYLHSPMSQQYNLGIERLLDRSTTITINYVGSKTTGLIQSGLYNVALTPGPGDPQLRAPFPYIVPSHYARNVGEDNYNALQVSLNRRYSSGLSFQAAYTWAKSIDNGNNGWNWGEGAYCQDPYHLDKYGCRGVADDDLTNFLSANLIYEVPVGKGRAFSTGNGFLDYVLGNWQANFIFLTRSGIPFTPTVGGDRANTGNAGYMHADLVGNPHLDDPSPDEWFNTSAYAVPARYTFGTASRNSLRGPGYWNLDGSLFRKFPIGESKQFQIRAEAFNLLNNVNFGNPGANLSAPATFGRITSTTAAREVQLVAKFIF